MSVVFDGGLVLPPVDGKGETNVVAFCNCAVDHEGHPASGDPDLYRRGCGRWGLVTPPEEWQRRKGATKRRRLLYWVMHPIRWLDRDLLRAAQPPNWGTDPSDRGWEAEALGGRTALTEIRQTAEKWSQSIAAILGVFTIVAFVKGPDSFADIHGSTAWAAGSLMLLALVLAGGGIWLGALAAQATPWKKTRLTGWELKKFYAHQTWKAANYLKYSRWFVLGGAVFVLAAVAVAWVASIPEANSAAKWSPVSGSRGDSTSRRCAAALSADRTERIQVCSAPGQAYDCAKELPTGDVSLLDASTRECKAAARALKSRGWID